MSRSDVCHFWARAFYYKCKTLQNPLSFLLHCEWQYSAWWLFYQHGLPSDNDIQGLPADLQQTHDMSKKGIFIA